MAHGARQNPEAACASTCYQAMASYKELLFCFALVTIQFLSEYHISGFAIVLPTINKDFASEVHSMWPASVLPLVISSMSLVFARVVDMCGGWEVFLGGLFWLTTWTVIAGFSNSEALLNVCRAMQGLSLAASQPASVALITCIYDKGKGRNLVLGVYGAMAPVGFFVGILSAGLVVRYTFWGWFFWTGAAISCVTVLASIVAKPPTSIMRKNRNRKLKMDWIGATSIASGLICVAYSLAASSHTGWKSPQVWCVFAVGCILLLAAAVFEAKVAASPLLPPSFFTRKAVTPFMVACLFFYGTFGIFLFYCCAFQENIMKIGTLSIVANFAPMALGGIFIAVFGGYVFDKVKLWVPLCFSGLAWLIAPILFAVAPAHPNYWAYIFPSMICATIGIDLTFTVSTVFLTEVQPAKYAGLAGAVCSVLVNLGMSFALALSDIIQAHTMQNGLLYSYKAIFWFAFALAAAGVLLMLFCGRYLPKADGKYNVRDSQDDLLPVVTPTVQELDVVKKQEASSDKKKHEEKKDKGDEQVCTVTVIKKSKIEINEKELEVENL